MQKAAANRGFSHCRSWSGRWDSNPRPQPWQGCALPLSYARIRPIQYHRGGGGPQGLALPEVARRRIVAGMAVAPLTPDQLFARLDSLGIVYRTYRHPPV